MHLLNYQAPTFLDLAGWPLPDDMDGQSLKPVLMGQRSQDVSGLHENIHTSHYSVLMLQTNFQFLVEYFGEGSSPGVGCMYTGPFINFRHGTYIYIKRCVSKFTTVVAPDCINNTFLALRTSDSVNGDQLFAEFFSTG